MVLLSPFIVVLLPPCSALLHHHRPQQNTTTTPTVKLTIDTRTRHQTIDGFGISQAFQRARQVQSLPSSAQNQTLNLLFDKDLGAGLSILRNGIGSSPSYDRDWMKSILPTSSGSPNATPMYEWDGDDAGQVWITKEALKRGVEIVYADAWSAPGFMKSNGNDSNGGYICGLPNTKCTTGDWRKAYADYLIQYLRFYKEREGVQVGYLGFLNEPDLNQTYASMQADGFQAADFLNVLRERLMESEFKDVKIVCCEATGWGDGEDMLSELQIVPGAEDKLDVYSAHGYSTHPGLPFNTQKKVWQTEWADLSGRWNAAWDDLGKEGEGIAWANKIHNAMTVSNVSAFLYWIGAQETPNNSALVRLLNGTVIPSKRLSAMGQYSRFVRPEAIRVEAKSGVGFVKVSAYVNADGKVVVAAINNGHLNVKVEVEIWDDNGVRNSVVPWSTNNEEDLEMGESIETTSGEFDRVIFERTMKKRSMTTFVW